MIKLSGTAKQTDQKLFNQLQLYKLPIACLQSSIGVTVNNHTCTFLGRVASYSHQFYLSYLSLSQQRCEDHHTLGAVERHKMVAKCTFLIQLITSWVPFVHRRSYVAYKTIHTPHLTGNKTLHKYCHVSVLILYTYTISSWFMVHLTTLSEVWTVQHQITGWVTNVELKRM